MSKICTNGHEFSDGKELCDRCNSPEEAKLEEANSVDEAAETPEEETAEETTDEESSEEESENADEEEVDELDSEDEAETPAEDSDGGEAAAE